MNCRVLAKILWGSIVWSSWLLEGKKSHGCQIRYFSRAWRVSRFRVSEKWTKQIKSFEKRWAPENIPVRQQWSAAQGVVGSYFRVEGPWEASSPASCSKLGQLRPGCSRFYSVRSWTPPSMETAQPLCAAPSTAWLTTWKKGFPLFLTWTFCISNSECCSLFSHHAPLWITWLCLLLASLWVLRSCQQSLLRSP